MRSTAAAMALMAVLLGCNQKKSDVALFDEGRITIDLSGEPRRGYEPLFVNFSAYLENRERTVRTEIQEIKWIVTGPDGFRREIVQETHNYQEYEDNKEDFFFWDFTFSRAGTYRVKLVLNEGQYSSPAVPVFVLERPRNR